MAEYQGSKHDEIARKAAADIQRAFARQGASNADTTGGEVGGTLAPWYKNSATGREMQTPEEIVNTLTGQAMRRRGILSKDR